jgi:hypothetical protein
VLHLEVNAPLGSNFFHGQLAIPALAYFEKKAKLSLLMPKLAKRLGRSCSAFSITNPKTIIAA